MWLALLATSAYVPAVVAANTEPNACSAATTVIVQLSAWVRSGPGTTYAASGSVTPSTMLHVVTSQHTDDGCWYYVEHDGQLGWIAGSVVAPTTQTDVADTAPSTLPTPTPMPLAGDVVGPPAGDPSTGTDQPDAPAYTGTDVRIPQVETPFDLEQRRVTVRVCLDINANQFCDVGDGIGGMPVFVLDGVTGTVLAWGRTDADGMLQLVVHAAPTVPVVVNIPYLGTFDTVMQDTHAVTRTVPFTPALPGLIP